MSSRLVVAGALLFLTVTPLSAQRLSGEGSCGRPEMTQAIPVGDRPGHSYAIGKNQCDWTKPFEMAGEKAVGGTAVQVDERNGNVSRFHGHYLDRMSGGDTVYYRYRGTTTFREDAPQSAEWDWTITGGSGKFRNVSGRGRCRGTWPEGKSHYTCTGSYRMQR